MKNNKIKISIYINKETKDKLNKIAEKENRSINKQINHIIQQYLNKD